MKRARLVLLMGLVAGLLVSVGATAEQDAPVGFMAEVGIEAILFPAGALDAWVDLGWDLIGLRFGNLTELTVLPAFGLGETLSVSYALDPFRFLAELGVDIVPLAFDDLGLSVFAGLIDVQGEDLEFEVEAGLLLYALPTFDLTFSIDADLGLWILDLWADADLDILTVVLDLLLGVEAGVLDLSWDEGGLSAWLGGETTILPVFDAYVWFDVRFDAGSFELRSETDIGLSPLGLIEQSVELTICFDGLRIYSWAGFRGDLTFLAGIGVTYRLPASTPPDGDGG